jgi:hypothetical protein
MRKLLFIATIFTFLISCKETKSEKNFVLTGNVKGLKNGTLIIQRIKDTVLVPIDTIKISEIHILKVSLI